MWLELGSKRKREKSTANDTQTSSIKRQKIDNREEIIKCVSRMRANRGWNKDDNYSINDFETCFSLLLTPPTDERQQIIMKSCDTCKIAGNNVTICAGCEELLQTATGQSYTFIAGFFIDSIYDTTLLSQTNKMKINIIRKISYPMIVLNGECNRTPILTIKSKEQITNWDPLYTTEYYNGAIGTLEEFTADIFLDSVKDFNFFRFVKIVPNEHENMEIDCTETEVLDLLKEMKWDDGTLLLLTFLMTAYYKNFLYKSIKDAVQYVSGIDNDTLSQIMSFMLTYYSSFNNFFQDKNIIRSLICEIRDASQSWQNIFVDIIENDNEYKKLYEPDVKQYSSERLTLLNMKMNDTQFKFEKFKKWLKPAVKNGHCDLFTKLMEDHCENKMNGFKFLFWYCAPHNKGEKWVEIIENQINKYKDTIKCQKELNELEELCNEWRAKVKKHRKTLKSKRRK